MPRQHHRTAPRALDGVLVADFSRVLAGPLAAATLADLGAEVVKVERPGSGDDTRSWGPPFADDGTAAYFDAANRSKRGLALDLGDPEDAAAARELARRADVLIENFRPGSLAKYGLDPAATLAANPGLVHCTISGFGSGAGAALPGYDFVVQAVGGLMSITGEPGGAPLKAGVALVDVLTAKDAATGILAALRHRDRTGAGQTVEVNLLSSLLASLVNQASGYLATGRDPGPMGNRHPSIAPYETLACRAGCWPSRWATTGSSGRWRGRWGRRSWRRTRGSAGIGIGCATVRTWSKNWRIVWSPTPRGVGRSGWRRWRCRADRSTPCRRRWSWRRDSGWTRSPRSARGGSPKWPARCGCRAHR